MPATATGIHHRSYASELSLRHTRAERLRLVLILLALVAVPFVVTPYWLTIANQIGIAVIGAIGLNILVGYTGQISLGQGGFLAVGAYTSALLHIRADLPVPVCIALAVLTTAAIGALFGMPALRLKGLYLAIATLASQEIILFAVRTWDWLTGGVDAISLPRLEVAGFVFRRDFEWYWIIVVFAVLAVFTGRNLFRTGLGRSFMAVRDQDIAASAMGVDVTRTKVLAFAISSAYAGLAGALMAHYTGIVTWERFTLDVSVLYLAIIIVGGLGSIAGTVYGAIFMITLPALITRFGQDFQSVWPQAAEKVPAVQVIVFGLVIVLFLIFEPRGLNRIWQRMKDYVRFWPFRY
ncbi:branched-chain amino acid ABC transporter permease [Phytoactinopolyspora mesophila]|uniref:Branched-chain amino acid ABC transporter permease n=1 Tax=Phytoactinopolyspora mesophila TaxID=2650750 RepID=A0A7K3M769_9ACTN|nr:branched-chain amino acid ABC transporter permease [Phytoactinopolyspora mesophila]NDL59114.1 branched-chain amino acid ABC transporter permease [Phytoactinopolyspora mesophila]